MMGSLRSRLAGFAIGVATALLVVAVAIVPFLTPVWMAFGQDRAQSTAWTGFTEDQLHAVTGSIVRDLVFGPPDFAVALPGQTTPVLTDAERSHMRDVRGVFAAFLLVALGSAALVAAAFALAREPRARARLWRRLSRTGLVIAIVTVAGGAIGVVIFDQAFILFHEVFFPGGNWSFDPRRDKLVQIFPDQFWSDTTVGLGIVIVGLALALWVVARRRADRHTPDLGESPAA